jgi:hypothetical protein
MNAMDKSASSNTYQCEAITERTNMLALNAIKFNFEEKTPLNVSKLQPIKGFQPLACSAYHTSYKCTKQLTTAISTSSTLTIGTGFSLAVKVGSSVAVDAKLFGIGKKTTFSREIMKTSFSVDDSKTNTYTTTAKTDVSVQVPENTEITINILREVQDLEYKWKAVFKLLGKYSAKWKNGQEIFQDVTTVLSGKKREIYAFGSWSYSATDLLRVVITDKYGTKKWSGCEHAPGKANSCPVSL